MSASAISPSASISQVVAAASTGSVTLGSGPDKLVLNVAEDAYQGNAEFVVGVDGTQIGGIQTATASHASGASQLFNIMGNFGNGTHTVEVSFLNDQYGGSSTADRNLYVNSSSIDGSAITGGSLSLQNTGLQTFTFTETMAEASAQGGASSSNGGSGSTVVVPTTIAVGSGSDTVALKISEDAFQGDAQFTVSVDGKQVGGTLTAQAPHANGQDQTLDIEGNFGAGTHTVAVDFLNDLYTPGTGDRNLYVDSASYDGATAANGTLTLDSAGTQTFTAVSSATYSEGVAGGTVTTLGMDAVNDVIH